MANMEEKLRAAVVAVRGVQIPEMPHEVILLEHELNGRYPNIKVAAEIIGKNTVLSGEVLKVVNSPVMKLKEPVKSIFDAVAQLGLNNLRNLVVSAAFKNAFRDAGLSRMIVEHSVDAAFCAADLSEWVEGISRDHAYLMGVFHNVGAIMLAAKDPVRYEKLYLNSLTLPLSILAKEQTVYGADHTSIGLLVGKKWHLDNETLTAIYLHHTANLESIENSRVRAMVSLLRLSTSMVANISYGAYRSEEARRFELDAMHDLMIDEKVVKEIRMALTAYSSK